MEIFKRPVVQMQEALDVLHGYPEHRELVLCAWFGEDIDRLPALTRQALGYEFCFSRDDITQDLLAEKDSPLGFEIGRMKYELVEFFESKRLKPVDKLREAVSRQLTLFDDEEAR